MKLGLTIHVGLWMIVQFFGANAQAPPDLQISRLTTDAYVFTTWKNLDGTLFPANGVYVVTDSGAILLDMPWDTRQTRPLADSIFRRHGKRIRASISTHFHDDRTGAIPILDSLGVATYASAQTNVLCLKEGNTPARHGFYKDTTLRFGKYTFQTYYPGPGHAPDNIVVYVPELGLLYGGCFVKSTESPTLGNLSDADVKAWPAGVRKVMKRFPKPRYVIPGHQDWRDGKGMERTLALLKEAGHL